MAEKESMKKIVWEEVLTRTEKNQGIPKATVVEAFKSVKKEIEQIIVDERPKTDGEMLVIKTPISGHVFKFIGEHEETDSSGVKYKVSPCIAMSATQPQSWSKLANTGFECTRKRIESK